MNDPFGVGLTRCTLAWVRLVTGQPLGRVRDAARPVLDIPGMDLWRSAAEIFIACADPVDAETAERMLRELRDHTPTIPFGTTRLGWPSSTSCGVPGLHSRAAELVQDLLAFARTHDERVAEPLLAALATN